MLKLVTERGVLNLFRRVGECIEIEGGITIRVLELRNKKGVRLQIIAPKEIGIMRSELCEKVLEFSRAKRQSGPATVQDSDPVPAA